MLIKNNGLKTDYFYLPPFALAKGEIVVINILGGGYFYETERYLKNIFTSNIVNKNVIVNQKLSFVEHFIEPKIRRLFYPITVKEYLNKNANSQSSFATKIYETEYINKRTKANSLHGKNRKLLNLYATLSYTNKIVFDLAGLDPQGSDEIYTFIKEIVKNDGGAILLDAYDTMKDDCTTYIELEWDLEKTQPFDIKKFKLKHT
jgi:hypothetical protein